MSELSAGSQPAAVPMGSTSKGLARVRSIPTTWIAVSAAVIWLVSGVYMLHFGSSWHLDLRVYRAAVHALYHHGSPFTAEFTSNHLPFTYTPFALLSLSP